MFYIVNKFGILYRSKSESRINELYAEMQSRSSIPLADKGVVITTVKPVTKPDAIYVSVLSY